MYYQVKFFAERPVSQISAGIAHTAALTREGEVFTWGGRANSLQYVCNHSQMVHMDNLVMGINATCMLQDEYIMDVLRH